MLQMLKLFGKGFRFKTKTLQSNTYGTSVVSQMPRKVSLFLCLISNVFDRKIRKTIRVLQPVISKNALHQLKAYSLIQEIKGGRSVDFVGRNPNYFRYGRTRFGTCRDDSA